MPQKRKRPDSVRVIGRSSNSPPPKSAHHHSTFSSPRGEWHERATPADNLVGPAGIEPATAGLEIRCSIRLSYGPIYLILHIFNFI